MSRAIAVKYAKVYAKEIGIEGDYGASGVDDNTAYNAFCEFMSNRGNENTATYLNIAHQLYMWYSIATVRKAEHAWGFGVRPPKIDVDLMVYGYENGSTLPKFKGEKRTYSK